MKVKSQTVSVGIVSADAAVILSLCWCACAGVWHSGVHRPGGDPQAGIREASGLVGDGGHPL